MATVREVGSGSDRALNRAFVVAGMHRSGTSAMTRTLSLLGAALPKQLMEERPDNPAGFWEAPSIATLNDEILAALDSDWDDVFAFRPRPYLSNFDGAFVGRAVDLLEEQFNGSEVIALKDPRVSVLTAFWDRVLTEAGYAANYIIMVRNPLEVAESLRKRNNFPREKSLLLWSSYMVAAERDTRSRSRIFVAYDDLMREWRAVRRRIEKTSGFPFPRDTAAAANEIDRFLDSGLRHHESRAEDLFSRDDIPDHVKTLYRLFSGACEDLEIDESVVDAVRAELTNIESQFGPLIADLRARTRTLEKDLAEVGTANAKAQARAEWLNEKLAAERAQRQADAEEASRLKAEHEQQLRELSERAAEAQASVDELKAALDDERTSTSQLQEQHEQQVSLLTERLSAAQSAIESEQASVTLLTQQLAAKELEAAEARQALALEQADKQELQRVLTDRITGLSGELKRTEEAVARTQQEMSGKTAEFQAMLGSSREETRAVEQRLEGRFGEIADLTRLLAETEAREARAREDAAWLREAGSVLLNGSGGGRQGIRGLLPAFVQRKRQRKMLAEKGLFDGDAYLAANPDVVREGIDPLEHYLKHGLAERRRRL